MKEKSTRHRDAIHKVADAVDNALLAVVLILDDDRPDYDGVLVQLAEARAYIVQAIGQAHAADVIESVKIDIENDQPRVYADEAMHDLQRAAKPTKLPKQRDSVFGDQHAAKLPKLKPQGHAKVKYKPGIVKLMKGAINFQCPTCQADPFTSCFKFSGPGKNSELTNERNDGSFYHAKRQDLAKAYNDRVRKANVMP